jgi:PAS domain S-box-containing protein
MRTEHRVLAVAVVLGFSFWIVDSAIDSLVFYDESFLESLLFDVDGIELYMRSLVVVLFLVFGLIVSRILVKQERIQKSLQDSEKRYMSLLEQASDAIILTDFEGKLLDVNNKALELFGYPKHKFLNKHYIELHPQEEAERVSEAFRNATKQGSGALNNTAILRKNGTTLPVDITGSVVAFKGERLVQAIFRDITERKREEETIRNIAEGVSAETGERFFHSLVNHISAILGLEYSFVGELVTEERKQVEIVALSAHSDVIDNLTYDLPNTPCETVVDKGLCYYPRDVQKQFPKDHKLKDMNAESYVGIPLTNSRGLTIGIMAVVGCQPLRHDKLVISTLQVFAARAAAELERKRVEEALRQSESALRGLSAELLNAQENERARLAADLHDGIGQTLGSLKVRIETILKKTTLSDAKVDVEQLKDLITVTKTVMKEVRNISSDLRPATLGSLGLIVTINWLCREFMSTFNDIGVEVRTEIQENEIPESLKIPIFRILQEALNNVSKHSEAHSVQVYLGLKDGYITLVIKDNGCGVDLSGLIHLKDGKPGFGIPSMKQRTEYSGGSFSFESKEGRGTLVQASWPITA